MTTVCGYYVENANPVQLCGYACIVLAHQWDHSYGAMHVLC